VVRRRYRRTFATLIRQMSVANPLWGAPRIHRELLKLGIQIGQTTVAKYMARIRRPPWQSWKTFLRNHADGIASMDRFVVPTVSFRLLYDFLSLRHSRSKLLWLSITARPSAEWIAHQLTEAYGGKGARASNIEQDVPLGTEHAVTQRQHANRN
jgi:hypothetical protein